MGLEGNVLFWDGNGCRIPVSCYLSNNGACEMTIKELLIDGKKFIKWSETAEGCDWCCGGGHNWQDDLDEQAKKFGFFDIEAFVEARGKKDGK
tara:strand:- start:33709 stop:33987 length:279 start_codon:yes stop_codon:yes gene_type:complete